jgi:hypothetical protein
LLAQRQALPARIIEFLPKTLDLLKIRRHGDLHLGQLLIAELDQDRLHTIGSARPLFDQRFTFTMRTSAILFRYGRDDRHAAVATFTAQPAKKTTL